MQILGFLFEGVGLLVAVYGLRERRREFAPPGRGAFDPAIVSARRRTSHLVTAVGERVRRILRRPQRIVVGTATLHLGSPGSVKLRGRAGFGPLPTGRSNKPALAELDRRTRVLLDRISDAQEAIQDQAEKADGDLGALRTEILDKAERIEARVQRLATGDVALQYTGMAMIGIGLVLQAIGAALAV
jgi:hypothetical protein